MCAVRSHAIQPISCGALARSPAKTVAANDALGGVSGSKIRLERFATHPLPRSKQLAAWRDWYDSVFDTDSRQDPETGVAAENMTWKLDDFAISHVSTPPVSLDRTRALRSASANAAAARPRTHVPCGCAVLDVQQRAALQFARQSPWGQRTWGRLVGMSRSNLYPRSKTSEAVARYIGFWYRQLGSHAAFRKGS